MASILTALVNIKKYGKNNLDELIIITKEDQPRINKIGDSLDAYIKDALCNSFHLTDPKVKRETYLSELSHLGSQNNPPDIMIKEGDALEVKKINGTKGGSIALNSSFPKQKINSDDPMINKECRNCEDWKEKDLVYVVGNVEGKRLRILVFVYGRCYASDKSNYVKIKDSMTEGINKIGLSLSPTRELARINKVDPLKITDFRVRGMWHIKSPLSVFSDLINPDLDKKLNVYAIIPEDKYMTFPKKDIELLEREFKVEGVEIKDPNNPETSLAVKLISFSF